MIIYTDTLIKFLDNIVGFFLTGSVIASFLCLCSTKECYNVRKWTVY